MSEKFTSLYGDTVELYFDEAEHKYSVSEQTYGDYPSEIPGTTSVLKVISKGDALIQWASNCAVEHVSSRLSGGLDTTDTAAMSEMLRGAKSAFRRNSKQACDVGVIVHQWIKDYLTSWTKPKLPDNPQASACCASAVNWIGEVGLRPLDVETLLYSKKYRYAGTLDVVGYVANGLKKQAVVDWKTSQSIYPEYRFQTAAYALAYTEQTGIAVKDRFIVRIGKDGSLDVLHLSEDSLMEDFSAFLGALSIYKRLKQLET